MYYPIIILSSSSSLVLLLLLYPQLIVLLYPQLGRSILGRRILLPKAVFTHTRTHTHTQTHSKGYVGQEMQWAVFHYGGVLEMPYVDLSGLNGEEPVFSDVAWTCW
jgi:hypothetical protein